LVLTWEKVRWGAPMTMAKWSKKALKMGSQLRNPRVEIRLKKTQEFAKRYDL
jgi:hypothetical protein